MHFSSLLFVLKPRTLLNSICLIKLGEISTVDAGCEGGAGEDRMLTRCVGVACGPKVGNGIWCRYTHFLFWHWHCHSVGTFVRLSLTLEVESLAWSLTF